MSSVFIDHLLLSFKNVKHRLETLLDICRIHVNSSVIKDDDEEGDDFYRFYGPYESDIEELEESIASVSFLIENLQHEQNSLDDGRDFLNYPLCKNGWTLKDIEQLADEEQALDLDILNHISLHTFNEGDQQFDEHQQQQYLTRSSHNEDVHTDPTPDLCLINDTNNNLLDLPLELLLHICSFLTPFELVTNLAPTCRYLSNLVLSRMYSHLDLSKLISVFDVTHLLSHLPYLHSITFTDWENHVSILTWALWFDRIARTTSHLHTIRFHNVRISPILICLLVEYFPRSLRTIKFDYQQNKNYEKFDLILSLLADQNIQLQHITASYQSGMTNFGISQLVKKLNTIVELNLLYVEAINDETVRILCDKHHRHLEILRIDGAQLSDKALEYIDQCRKLQMITIEFCTNMTGSNFHRFQNFCNLKELCLAKLTTIPLESFQILFNRKHIFEHLIVLKLGECHLIDDSCIQAIILMCPRLIDLTCSWAYNLTDDSFNEIVMRCRHLRRLSLLGCHLIYGQILKDVPDKYLHHIEYLNFEQCNQIEDDVLIGLCRRKKSISILDYYGSRVYDDE